MLGEYIRGFIHSRSKQRTNQRVLVLTLKFLALQKIGFSPVKKTSQNFFDFCLPLFYATIFSKKLKLMFYPWKLKKRASKVAHNRPKLFSQSSPAHSPKTRIDFSYFQDTSVSLFVVSAKAMKSSPLLGPFSGSEFWGFSLLKI